MFQFLPNKQRQNWKKLENKLKGSRGNLFFRQCAATGFTLKKGFLKDHFVSGFWSKLTLLLLSKTDFTLSKQNYGREYGNS